MTLRVGEIHWLRLNELVHLRVVAIACVEWRESNNHLVGQDTERPPVNRERVSLFDKNFRRQVVWCPAKRESLLAAFQNFSEPEVCQTYVAVLVHENIFWLKVSINNLLVVEVAERQSNLDGVEFSAFLIKSLCLAQVHKELAATDEAHYEENLLVCHKYVVHANEEWVISLHQNVLLELCRLYLVIV